MRELTIILYHYDELPTEQAKARAREWFSTDYLDYEWWDYLFEDAERIGLKITDFDLGNWKQINGHLTISVEECCKKIMAEHGQNCDTYKLAERWRLDPGAREDEDEEKATKIVFTDALLKEYFSLLDKEYEYMTSKEHIEEVIRINEYEFTEDGRIA